MNSEFQTSHSPKIGPYIESHKPKAMQTLYEKPLNCYLESNSKSKYRQISSGPHYMISGLESHCSFVIIIRANEEELHRPIQTRNAQLFLT